MDRWEYARHLSGCSMLLLVLTGTFAELSHRMVNTQEQLVVALAGVILGLTARRLPDSAEGK